MNNIKIAYIVKRKIITLLILTAMTATPIVVAEECLPPSDISIIKDATGKFIVNVPSGSGYQFSGENYPISATGPISFISVEIDSWTRPPTPEGPYDNIFALNNVSCWYGVHSSRGQYPGGIFILSKINSRDKSYDLSGDWSWDLYALYQCRYNPNDCQFSVHS